MAGLLTHLIISAVLFILVFIASRKWIYGFSIAAGQLVPDVLKFGIPGIKLWTANPSVIVKDKLFWALEKFGSDYHTWVNLGIFILSLSLFLYYIGKIKKNEAKEINWAYLFLVIGIAIHLIIDIFIIEHSYWI